MKSSTLFRVVVAAVAVLLTFAALAQAGQEKVDVCHITGTATVDGVPDTPVGHVINVAEPAYEAHIRHGDPEQWRMVTLDDGREVCTPGVGPLVCPAYTVEILQDDLALYETEFPGESTCYDESVSSPRGEITTFSFYGPGCPPMCFGWVAEAGWYLDADTNTVNFARAQDFDTGPPPPTREFMNLTPEQMAACKAVLLEFAASFECQHWE